MVQDLLQVQPAPLRQLIYSCTSPEARTANIDGNVT